MMQLGENRDSLLGRVKLLSWMVGVALICIGSFFWFAQVVRGAYYYGLAENNRLRKIPIRAPRGIIYDRHGRPLVENVTSYNLLLDRSHSHDLPGSVAFAAWALGRPAEELHATLDRNRSLPTFAPVLLGENLTLSQVARFGAENLEHPEFEIEVGHLRLYRHGEQTAEVLGHLGEPSLEELTGPEGADVAGEMVGKKGIEQRYDARLRGRRGEKVVVVDSRGRVLEEHAGESAQPGQSLALTLDLDLQQAAERYLQDKVGAVVALDPKNGEVLALSSSPSYDPNLFARRLSSAEWQQLLSVPNNPFLDRPLQNTYSPGSVFKVVVATAGAAEHVIDPGDAVWCRGVSTFYNHPFRCWRKEGHGRVDFRDALRRSCDTYFYQLGQKLGIERIARYARMFGLGTASGLDLAGEKNGLVPDEDWSRKVRHQPWYAGETISVAIGQGPLLVTPLQIAVMMAVVANGGYRVTPHLLVADPSVPPPAPLPVDGEALRLVREGLWSVVNDPQGTGRGAFIPGLNVAGKTGTVQVVAQKTWTENATLPFEQRDHAWFASFAPLADPRLVVVVFIEHGGHGADAAAPLAKILYESYFRILAPADTRQPA